jgi:hypothetical protein
MASTTTTDKAILISASEWDCQGIYQDEDQQLLKLRSEVSERARERIQRGDRGYPRVTVENAAAAVARNYGKGAAGPNVQSPACESSPENPRP